MANAAGPSPSPSVGSSLSDRDRKTGRTTRMLDQVISLILSDARGKVVLVYGGNSVHARTLCRKLVVRLYAEGLMDRVSGRALIDRVRFKNGGLVLFRSVQEQDLDRDRGERADHVLVDHAAWHTSNWGPSLALRRWDRLGKLIG